jgi:omega-6 fatty acid desaturase (delta-12 desaturase)
MKIRAAIAFDHLFLGHADGEAFKFGFRSLAASTRTRRKPFTSLQPGFELAARRDFADGAAAVQTCIPPGADAQRLHPHPFECRFFVPIIQELRVDFLLLAVRKKAQILMSDQLSPTEIGSRTDNSAWKQVVKRYQKPSAGRATWQIVNTLVPYAALWYLIYLSLAVSWWLTVPLAALAGAFTVRAFIIFHDCGHGSFFDSRAANHIVGAITGVLTFTPFYHWRWQHAIHHATAGDLDRRGTGDVWTLTVREYLESSRWKRFAYRLARNPLVLFVLAPLFLFLVMQRVPSRDAPPRERRSVYWTNLGIAVVALGLIWLFGLKAYLIVQLTVLLVAGSAGVWLFYVQHQFEGVYWNRSEEWDYATAALQGSSFYKLPKVLQWFSGNIGYHHIHHLSTRIPNYYLEKCQRDEPLFQTVRPITLVSSFKCFNFRLWDEQRRKLVGFNHLKSARAEDMLRRKSP